MGPSDSKAAKSSIDFSINHPKFSNAKFLTEDEKNRRIEIAMGIDEKDFKSWKESLSKHKINPEYLLLPVKEDFSSQGLCGSSGTLKVNSTLI